MNLKQNNWYIKDGDKVVYIGMFKAFGSTNLDKRFYNVSRNNTFICSTYTLSRMIPYTPSDKEIKLYKLSKIN